MLIRFFFRILSEIHRDRQMLGRWGYHFDKQRLNKYYD